jgi:hypothetical protein
MADPSKTASDATAGGTPQQADATPEAAPMALSEFMEQSPPSQIRVIEEEAFKISESPSGDYLGAVLIPFPDLQLHCDHPNCGGLRTYRPRSSDDKRLKVYVADDDWSFKYVTYVCGNCGVQTRTFSIAAQYNAEGVGRLYKFGELPAFGPKTSARLISLIGPDRDLFLRGRRCESHGLGIGAFGYYRRVVERQKDRILDEIIRVATKLKVSSDTIDLLRQAQKEIQFSKAIGSIKDAIPQSLLVNGHNPLTLLHSALSRGLHEDSDVVCLQLAHDIRVVLAELSERLAQALKDEAELNTAITRLLNR